MLLSRKWLDEFVHVDANDKDFAEAMTLSGSKVETTEDRGAEISNIVVGTILTMERHPDSDHMWICQLDVGQSAPIQIVTGAWNIHPGDMVPVALDHSTLPGGKKIEKGKLRGVESNGMMCGLYELGLDERDRAESTSYEEFKGAFPRQLANLYRHRKTPAGDGGFSVTETFSGNQQKRWPASERQKALSNLPYASPLSREVNRPPKRQLTIILP